MKKKCIRDALLFCIKTKTWKIMRLSAFFLLVCFSHTWAISGYSQETKLTLKMSDSKIIEVLNKIEEQSEFYFLFNQRLVNVEREVDIDVEEKTIDNILQGLFAGTNVNYLIYDRQIILTTFNKELLPEQTRAVSGKVTDSSGQPLPGVSVILKGTTQGTITNADGEYTLAKIPPDATLLFSFVGMQPQEIETGTQTEFNITMEEQVIALDEVVAIGYGTIRRSDLTGAVSQVNAADFERVPATTPLLSLQGRSPGLRIVPNSGEPGASASIRIRGEQSIEGTNDPIFVIDGIISTNIDYLNSEDIESVSVLKDASVVAIYGARAANGVILITTKRGEEKREPVIAFHTYHGLQQRSNLKIELLNAEQWLELWTESYENAGIPTPWDSEVLEMYKGVDEDWPEAVMRTGVLSNYNLSVTGGTEKSNYFVSAAYQDNKGMVVGMNYDRLNLRLNTDHKIRNWIRFGNSLNVYSVGQDASVGQYTRALQKVPITRIYEDDGSWGRIRNTALEHMHSNALWLAETYANRYEDKGIMGNLYLTLSLLEGLEFTARGNLEWNNDYRTSFEGGIDPMTLWEGSTTNRVIKDNRETLHWITDYLLDFNRTFFEKHSVTALAGYSLEEQLYERLEGRRTGTPNNEIRFLNAGDPASQLNLNSYSDWAFASLFGRVGYTYDNKYILSASVRSDGTSRLHADKRYGVFPSVSLAWRIAEETFMDPYDWLNELKLRASWGETGNALSVSTYGTVASLSARNYPMNQEPSQGYTMASAVNTDLQWESTEKKNIGLDVTLLNNSVYLISDFYIEDTHDLLFEQPIPLSTGLSGSPYINAGHIRNTGIEIEIGIKRRIGDWYYSVSANGQHSKNEVIDLEGRDLRTEGIVEGFPLKSFFGYKTNGLILTQNDMTSHPQFAGKQIGDIWLLDVDGMGTDGKLTGKPDGVVNANDRTILDGKYPKLIYGMMGTLAYKNWTFQMQLQGVQGVKKDIRGGTNLGVLNYFTMWAMNHDVLLLDRYHPTKNPDGIWPRVDKADSGNNVNMPSDFWLKDASFMRVSNVNINYDVPDVFTRQIGVGTLSIYGSVQNLYTFTNFYGPEVDSNADVLTGVPQPRTWTLGLKVTF